jgi:hypothetical protein
MICQFCERAIESESARFSCRFCKAEYEAEGVGLQGRILFAVVAEPPPEKHNLVMVQKRLAACAKKVLMTPGDALTLLEDIWVELAANCNVGTNSQYLAELTELRQRVTELQDALPDEGRD